jgi:hypothetical protein
MARRWGERAQKEQELRERVRPTDAAALSGYHLKELLSSWPTVVLIAAVAAAVGWLASSGGHNVGIGLAFFLLVFAIGVGVVSRSARSRGADDFFVFYAETHGLELRARRQLPASTPLLRRGDRSYASRSLGGQIAPGIDGVLALFTSEETSGSGTSSANAVRHDYTLGLVEIFSCADHVPELYCQRRSGLSPFERLGDAFRGSKRRVSLESEALDDRYDIFVREDQDEIWLRRLFSPTFVVWLAQAPPADLSFELVDGTLVTYVLGYREDAGTLDAIAAATGTIAQRLLEESAQTS